MYLQHQGHSRTVVGVETEGVSGVRLLVLDPSHTRDNVNSDNLIRMVRKTVKSMRSRQYQLVVVRGLLTTGEQKNATKIVSSTRIPP